MRDWKQKERLKRPTGYESLEPDSPQAEGGFWDNYGLAVWVVVIAIVTAGVCNSLVNLLPR